MFTAHRRTPTPALLGLLGLLALAACDDTADPLAPDTADTLLSEAVIDGAADQVELEQEVMFDQSQRTRPSLDRAELAVGFAVSAVDLSTELLREAGGGDAAQQALLGRAESQSEGASEALAAGRTAQAVRLAHGSVWTAMKAWILPGGVTDEEVRLVHSTAEELLRQASAAVGGDDGLNGQVLSWAETFFARGEEKIESGQPRGVAALWKAAVLSHWLLG
ncbi:hypothetical protein V3331_15395 [Gaopeijia maritima]|uniref:hypothetical protein n=1 Tax=Gaopeijia maritima TaxID=3119007 RepID=UPI00324B168E